MQVEKTEKHGTGSHETKEEHPEHRVEILTLGRRSSLYLRLEEW